jgi:pre-mRNA cleavage complex 2 protein Pcf11
MDLTELPEVVQDFQEALEDLHENSKPAIDVLTVIAKENTDHAEYISAVLERHIRTVHLIKYS